jgi:hypothetical protein
MLKIETEEANDLETSWLIYALINLYKNNFLSNLFHNEYICVLSIEVI